MIKPFEKSDLEKFTPNELSGIDDIMPLFTDDRYHKYSVWGGGIVKAIIYFIKVGETERAHFNEWAVSNGSKSRNENVNNEWAAFCLISNTFNAINSKQIRDFTEQMAGKFKPHRLWTLSLDCPIIEKWHKWLMLTKEDAPIIFNNQRYNIWSRSWQ